MVLNTQSLHMQIYNTHVGINRSKSMCFSIKWVHMISSAIIRTTWFLLGSQLTSKSKTMRQNSRRETSTISRVLNTSRVSPESQEKLQCPAVATDCLSIPPSRIFFYLIYNLEISVLRSSSTRLEPTKCRDFASQHGRVTERKPRTHKRSVHV